MKWSLCQTTQQRTFSIPAQKFYFGQVCLAACLRNGLHTLHSPMYTCLFAWLTYLPAPCLINPHPTSCGAIHLTWGTRGIGNKSSGLSPSWWLCCLADAPRHPRSWNFYHWRRKHHPFKIKDNGSPRCVIFAADIYAGGWWISCGVVLLFLCRPVLVGVVVGC